MPNTDQAEQDPQAQAKGCMQHGCDHYKRRCKLVAPCCGEVRGWLTVLWHNLHSFQILADMWSLWLPLLDILVPPLPQCSKGRQ